jgi:hypothetical protein
VRDIDSPTSQWDEQIIRVPDYLKNRYYPYSRYWGTFVGGAKMPKAELEQYEDEHEEMASATGKTRMVDWLQCCKLPVVFSVFGFLVLYGFAGSLHSGSTRMSDLIPRSKEDAAVVILLVAYLVLGPLAVWAQLMGTVFDGPRDSLKFGTQMHKP